MTALNMPCAGCRAPVDTMQPEVAVFRRGNGATEYYHEACWLTGWYTGIPFKGDPWPEEVGHGASDPVNNPSHYRWLPNGIEVIDITESFNFLLGNVLKYVMRADHKGRPLEDLEKAAWYLAREIANRKNSGVV